ncbi:uncharacterized protein LOC142565893 [Dermacentor variabilis]|uniref:uncharacterized protein LOC142565893 n=1 Tax=Dermacentor variabilis TaxID=34621 RepID=UPI003F5CB13F
MAVRKQQRVLFRRIENVEQYFKRGSLLRGNDLYASIQFTASETKLGAADPSDVGSVDYDVRLQAHQQAVPVQSEHNGSTCSCSVYGYAKQDAWRRDHAVFLIVCSANGSAFRLQKTNTRLLVPFARSDQSCAEKERNKLREGSC